MYAQDLLADWEALKQVREAIQGKGFKGAVGTAAAYGDLMGMENYHRFEVKLSVELDLPFFPVSTQRIPAARITSFSALWLEWVPLCIKSPLTCGCCNPHRLARSANTSRKKQVGSSAMPFKRNPINAEKIDSLARLLAMYPQAAWQNAANSLLERTLDDSANRRTILPEAFLAADEMLLVLLKLVSKMSIHRKSIQRNLEIYAPFACTER